jgi:transposase InsO family protein
MTSQAKRKEKHSRRQTLARRRQADLQQQRRKRFESRRVMIKEVKRRRRIVRHYHRLRQAGSREADAAQQTAAQFACGVASVRRYAQAFAQGGMAALKPRPPGPQHPASPIPMACQLLVVTIRTLLGWCGQRISAELKRRQIGTLSHTSIYRLFRRYHLKRRTYHPKGIRPGIDYQRWERDQANDLWHVDFKGPIHLGSIKLYLFVIEDDYSRYVLDVHVGRDSTADTAIARVQQAIQTYGAPRQLMSDNGRAFTSVWESVDHRFEQALRPYGVEHLLIPPYYPEENGKVEAFIKILSHEALAVLVDHVDTPQQLQNALDTYVAYYNNYRLHSALNYQPPVKRYLGYAPKVWGLAGLWNLPDLGCPEWIGGAEPPPSPTRALILRA